MTGVAGDALGDRGAVVGPRLRRQGIVVHGLVHDPALLSGRLQDEHVVHVVVRIEAAVGRRRDVGVGLNGMAEIVDHARTKSMSGGHSRCRPCSTIVAPEANWASTLAESTWSGISAPKPAGPR